MEESSQNLVGFLAEVHQGISGGVSKGMSGKIYGRVLERAIAGTSEGSQFMIQKGLLEESLKNL